MPKLNPIHNTLNRAKQTIFLPPPTSNRFLEKRTLKGTSPEGWNFERYINTNINSRNRIKITLNNIKKAIHSLKTHKEEENIYNSVGQYKNQMEKRISQLQRRPHFKEGLRQTCKLNIIPPSTLNGLTTKKMRMFYQRTHKQYNFIFTSAIKPTPQKPNPPGFKTNYAYSTGFLSPKAHFLLFPSDNSTQSHWQELNELLPSKSTETLQFEARKLLSLMAEAGRPWSQQECLLLRKIVAELNETGGHWNSVSRTFYELSNKQWYRSSKQCREQWFNHLDESKKHGQWSSSEDITILKQVLSHGHSWAKICRETLSHRTEHMVKNRFKSLLLHHSSEIAKPNYNQRKIIRRILQKLQDDPNNNFFKIKPRPTIETQPLQGQLQQEQLQRPLQSIISEHQQRQNYQSCSNIAIEISEPRSIPLPQTNIPIEFTPSLITYWLTFPHPQLSYQYPQNNICDNMIAFLPNLTFPQPSEP